jgi:hypothetical protein
MGQKMKAGPLRGGMALDALSPTLKRFCNQAGGSTLGATTVQVTGVAAVGSKVV